MNAAPPPRTVRSPRTARWGSDRRTPHCGSERRVLLAAEAAPAYASAPGCEEEASDLASHGPADEDELLGTLQEAVDTLCDHRLDELSDDQIVRRLEAVEPVRRQLETWVAKATRTLSRRAGERAARNAPPGRADREAGRAEQRQRQELAEKLKWSPGDAKRNENDGRRLERFPEVAAAASRGQLTTRHARVLEQVLRYLKGDDRDRLEAELIAIAPTQDPTTFGQTARRRLAEIDGKAANVDHDLRHQRRRASISKTDDGMMRLFGEWTGIDAETIATAVHAFRRPNGPSEMRGSLQITADAIVDVAKAALAAADAPSEHGVRPHVNLTIPISMLKERLGVGDAPWSGPIPYDALRDVLEDVGLSWIVTDEGGLPMEAGPEVRTVPRGLLRALHVRDAGCIHEDCDMPPSFCQVMHLDEPYAQGGRLSLDNAALGCHWHHRQFDRRKLDLNWDDGRPVLRPGAARRPGSPVRAGPAP